MPLFRFKLPPAGLEDATYLHDENPDPERYEEATETEAPAAPETPEESE